MTNRTWLVAFEQELAARGVTPADRASALVEAEGFLTDAGADAYHQFGDPLAYAFEVAQAVGGRRQAGGDGGPMLLEARGITKRYGATPVVADVSFRLRAGRVVALRGDNGVGKSTLLRILAGLEAPTSGTVACHGAVGYVPQHGGLDPYLTPDEHFVLFGTAYGLSARDARRAGRDLANELGWDAATAPIAAKLSGGTAQKLRVVVGLLGNAPVLLLDEPYQGMDARSGQRFWSLLWSYCDQGSAAVVASHDREVLARAQTVLELDEVGSVPR